MKVKVIGSGSMWNAYNSACFLIDDDIMIDMPNGACKYLYRHGIEPSSINHVLLTHFHGDHYFDIPFYILNKSKHNSTKTIIYCYKGGKKKLKNICYLAFPNSYIDAFKESNASYNCDEEFKIEKYSVKKIEVDHGRLKPCYGYLFQEKDLTVGFTGDTSFCKAVEDMASVCSHLFIDCMHLVGTNKHQGIDNLKVLSKKYKNCTFYPVHMDNETRNELQKLKFDNVIIPEDGDAYFLNV